MQGVQAWLAFSESAKRGGFAAAARELGCAPSTLAKAVARLEAALGLRLFHRTTRKLSLTADGERLFERCQRVLAELEELQTEAAGARAEPAGLLRIDMPVVYGRRRILPLLAQLLQRHPGLRLDARFSDGYVDLVRDGIDLAIRTGELADSRLVARRIDAQALLLVGAPAYLRAQGLPRRVEDLAAQRCLVFRLPASGRDRPLQFGVDGELVELRPEHGLRFDDGEAMVQAALLGLGLAQVPEVMVAEEIAAGRLREVLARQRPPPLPVYAVMPANRLVPARVRALLDLLGESLQPGGGAS